MPISVTCQTCGAILPIPEEFAGKSVRCGGCQGVVEVPGVTSETPVVSTEPVLAKRVGRPIAMPVSRTEPKSRGDDSTRPKGKRVWKRLDDESDEEPEKVRPKRQRQKTALTGTGTIWLYLLAASAFGGLITFCYCAVSTGSPASRLGNGQRASAAPAMPFLPQPPMLVPAPAPQVFEPIQPIEDKMIAFDPPPGMRKPAGPVVASSNAIVKANRVALVITASSQYPGWGASKAFDDDEQTSWFSQLNQVNNPWIRVAFPNDIIVRRVTILGNREPNFPKGYDVLDARLELFDRDENLIASRDLKSIGERNDFECIFKVPYGRVRSICFTSTRDERNSRYIALGEFQVE